MNANDMKPASIAAQALAKVASKRGTPAHSLDTLLAERRTPGARPQPVHEDDGRTASFAAPM